MKLSRSHVCQHLSIIIAVTIIIASSLNLYYAPNVEADLPGPYYVRGYINESDGEKAGAGLTVTVTNTDRDTSGTTTTIAEGAYQINVGKNTGFDCSNGDHIVVNCSNATSSEVGENETNIDTSATFVWCNLSGGTQMEAETLSTEISPTTWNIGSTSYDTSYNTTDTYFNITNDGNVPINVKIQGENFTWNGNKWNLTNVTAINNYSLSYKQSGAGSWTNITIINSSFITDLDYNSSYFDYTYWKLYGLNFTTPTSSSPQPSGSQQLNATFWSIRA